MGNNKEEIDLISVIINIKNGIAGFFKWVIKTTIKKIPIVLIFVIIGVGLGFSFYNVKKPVFISELTVSHTRFNNDQCYELIDNLTQLNGKYVPLAKILKTDLATISKVKNMTYQPLNARVTKIFNDSALVMLPFKIIVEAYDASVYDTLQPILMNYLESNEFGVRRKQIDFEYWTNFEAKLQKEIKSVDSLKQIVNESIKRKNVGNGVLIDEPIDPVKISVRTIELQNAQLKVNEKLKLNNSFEVLVGFNGGVEKTADVLMSMIYGFLAGYLLSLIWLYAREQKSIMD